MVRFSFVEVRHHMTTTTRSAASVSTRQPLLLVVVTTARSALLLPTANLAGTLQCLHRSLVQSMVLHVHTFICSLS